MAAVVYDTFPGTNEEQKYLQGSNVDTSMYPDSNNISVFGPLWLPRVYGKDLTSFEIASSGKIAITINDVHALDISNTTGKTQLSAKSNDSFEISVSSNSMYMTFDATTDDVSVVASKGDVNVVASNDLSFTGSNNVNVTALSNVVVSASNAATFTAIQGSMTFKAEQDTMVIDMNADSNQIYVLSQDGSITVAASNNVTVASSNDILMTASNDYVLTVKEDLSMAIDGTGVFALSANSSNMFLVFDGPTNTTSLYSSNDVTLQSLNDIYLKGHDSNATLTLGDSNVTLYAISNVALTASNDVHVQALEDITLTAVNSTIGLYANDSRTSIVLNTNNDIVFYSSNDTVFSASNSFSVTALSNVTVIADNGDIALAAESNVSVYADNSNMLLTMDRNGDALTIYSLSNVFVTACNAVAIDSRSNVSITASSNIEMFSRSNIVANTSNSVLITACNYVTINSTSNISMATYDTTLNTSNDFIVTACNDVLITAQNDLTLTASNMAFSLTGDLAYRAASNISFYINQSSTSNDPTFLISPDRVNVRGDLYISGSINTSNIINTTVVEQTLKINDKTILLASEGDEGGAPIDSALTNGGAGIIVDGLPASESNVELWRKSIQWDYGTSGMSVLGTDSITTEPAWEFLGGGIRVTHKRVIGGEVKDLSFTFRVNEKDELELVKKYWNAATSDYIWKRVAKFGKILTGGNF